VGRVMVVSDTWTLVADIIWAAAIGDTVGVVTVAVEVGVGGWVVIVG
jgi:hypothetical protein